jgi:PAS domain S-box-containing protein
MEPQMFATKPIREPHASEKKRMGRILVVEDSPFQALQLQRVLEGECYIVEIARDGEKGFDLFHKSDFDLVISDILMPGISGFELCRKIKDDPASRNMPVILLTSLTDPMDIVKGLESGADNFITKPYQVDYLLGRVKAILDIKALRNEGEQRIGHEVIFLGQKLTINSDKEQILGLLMATFEDVVRTNRQLQASQAERKKIQEALQNAHDELERRVEQRTAELLLTNSRLHQEMSDREKAESTVFQLAAIVESSDDAIVGLNLDGLIQTWNSGAQKLYGYAALEVMGKPFSILVPSERANRLVDRLAKIKCGTHVEAHETMRIRKDGTLVDVSAQFSAIKDRNGTIIGISSINHDITEQKKLKDQFRQAQKMEAFGQLAGGVAHDFNNLLTVIGGYSDLLLSNSLPAESSRGLIEEIKKAGDRAAGLTRQLLAFSRQQVLAPTVLDLNAIVRDTEKMLKRLIGEDIELTSVLDLTLARVMADPGQIEQVVMNLAVNARDAMPQGGKLTIETGNVDLDDSYAQLGPEVKPGRYATLAVSDTGCGMNEATKQRLFEPFFTTKEVGKGTGLGLATVYGIVKQGSGFIQVYSEPGVGSTFKVYFPSVKEKRSSDKAPSGHSKAATGTETLLLVEDEDGVRQFTRRVLLRHGYTVLEASQATEAIRICEQHSGPIHLIVSDVVMPGMGGRKLAEHLITLRPEIKVLYVSGYTDDSIVRHGVVAAETAFLQKPFTPVALAKKVREVLDQ